MNGIQNSDEVNERKKNVAALSVISNSVLVIFKLIAGISIGSIGIISEAIHSGIDLIASGIAFLSVKKSGRPPDECHAYGHGKYEDISGMVEALLIFAAAGIILWEALQKLVFGGEPISEEFLAVGIVVMLISACANWFVSSKLFEVADATGSIALESDGWHLRTDVYTSLGVFAGLILIKITGLEIIDPLIAVGISLIIIHTAYGLVKRSFWDLTDKSLPPEDTQEIESIILQNCGESCSYTRVRTRRSGPDRHVEFDLIVPPDMDVASAHALTEKIEDHFYRHYGRVYVTIHIEPDN
ncbi:cation diffusion facilitator family transporter [Methanoplanus endosymbiosus]|uniref:Cation diffusion facilitator family transporter n=1 Tax=Methanoplanus endosymbiosus TaxID=33865 RepID=A0A9E7TMY0_9EURY|nr:cation diffusion facilitator family transporter [Methanoplanus endosymbiosus]UUX93826.1 cation diffusion facilitator family transporter [Methanoplanus endosymbiosus]